MEHKFSKPVTTEGNFASDFLPTSSPDRRTKDVMEQLIAVLVAPPDRDIWDRDICERDGGQRNFIIREFAANVLSQSSDDLRVEDAFISILDDEREHISLKIICIDCLPEGAKSKRITESLLNIISTKDRSRLGNTEVIDSSGDVREGEDLCATLLRKAVRALGVSPSRMTIDTIRNFANSRDAELSRDARVALYNHAPDILVGEVISRLNEYQNYGLLMRIREMKPGDVVFSRHRQMLLEMFEDIRWLEKLQDPRAATILQRIVDMRLDNYPGTVSYAASIALSACQVPRAE